MEEHLDIPRNLDYIRPPTYRSQNLHIVRIIFHPIYCDRCDLGFDRIFVTIGTKTIINILEERYENRELDNYKAVINEEQILIYLCRKKCCNITLSIPTVQFMNVLLEGNEKFRHILERINSSKYIKG